MDLNLRFGLLGAALTLGIATQAQRYLTEVFTNDEITVTPDVVYGTNIDFLTSNLASPMVPADVVALQTAVATGMEIPAAYFDPTNGSTGLKVTNVRMDIYQPDQSIDQETNRPVMLYLHTGNALPPPLNGSPNGRRTDSTAVEVCRRFARLGYVAVSMSYRGGWNPLAPTEQERRGQLLNAIYRAIHDVRQCVRTLKQDAGEFTNQYHICPDRIVVVGEGTGGYIALGNATMDDASELYIEKFRPDPFDPTRSYIDSTQVGNLDGFGGNLTLYRPNGFDHETHFCVNLGGALADTSWLDVGDVPMVAFHTVFDPFAPFTEGIVIVPTTGGPVVPVQGSNLFMELVNEYGNNDAFASFPDGDPFTDGARSQYGASITHGSTTVDINTDVEGLYPLNRPFLTSPFMEEASPWQFWDPNSPLATAVVSAGPPPVTAHQASLASNPDMSPEKARTYIDTIMGYAAPRIHAVLMSDGACSFTSVDEPSIANGVEVFPNPASVNVTFSSSEAKIVSYEVFDVNGRLVRSNSVNATRITMDRKDLKPGAYNVRLRFADGFVTRKLMLD